MLNVFVVIIDGWESGSDEIFQRIPTKDRNHMNQRLTVLDVDVKVMSRSKQEALCLICKRQNLQLQGCDNSSKLSPFH